MRQRSSRHCCEPLDERRERRVAGARLARAPGAARRGRSVRSVMRCTPRGAVRHVEALEQTGRRSRTRALELVGAAAPASSGGDTTRPLSTRDVEVLERLRGVAQQALAPGVRVVDDDQRVVGQEVEDASRAPGWSSGASASAPGRYVPAQQRVEQLVDGARGHVLARPPARGSPRSARSRASRSSSSSRGGGATDVAQRLPASAGSPGRTRGSTRPRRPAARRAPAARAGAGRGRGCRRAPRARRGSSTSGMRA